MLDGVIHLKGSVHRDLTYPSSSMHLIRDLQRSLGYEEKVGEIEA